MKKTLILTLSLCFVFNTCFAQKTNAVYIDDKNITWWTVPELLEYKQEIEQEESDLCGDDIICRRNLHAERLERDPKYQALFILERRQFLITTINPKAETLKILFFNEDMRLKQPGSNEQRNLELATVFVAWFDNPKDEIRSFYAKEEQYFNGEIPGMHTIFKRRIKTDGEWFLDYNTEVEFSMADDSNIIDKKKKSIHYIAQAVNYFNMSGIFSHPYCSLFEEYDENTECAAFVSAEKGVEYFTSEKTIEPVEDNCPDNEPIDENGSEDNGIIGNIDSDDEDGEENDGYGSLDSETLVSINNNSSFSIKAPNTGELTSSCERTIEFPWWIGVLLLIGGLTLVWLFWPNNQKKRQKKY